MIWMILLRMKDPLSPPLACFGKTGTVCKYLERKQGFDRSAGGRQFSRNCCCLCQREENAGRQRISGDCDVKFTDL